MKNVMRSEITYLFWLSYVVFLSSGQGLPRKFANCVFVLINKRSFEPFMCLVLLTATLVIEMGSSVC